MESKNRWERNDIGERLDDSKALLSIWNQFSADQMMEETRSFSELMVMYECAIKEVTTKLEVLNLEFVSTKKRNPIESIQSRIKRPESIFEKMNRKGISYSRDNMVEYISDIAGVRVICPFIEDIYTIAEMLLQQDDIKLLQEKDYIKEPKENGYRSLHLVVEIPIFLSDRKQAMKVEVQIRTIAMNFWASLEHQIHYKKHLVNSEQLGAEMKECADIIHQTDQRMQEIRNKMKQ